MNMDALHQLTNSERKGLQQFVRSDYDYEEMLTDLGALESLHRILTSVYRRMGLSVLPISYDFNENMRKILKYMLECTIDMRRNFLLSGYGAIESGKTRFGVLICESLERMLKNVKLEYDHRIYTVNLDVKGWEKIDAQEIIDLTNCTIIADEFYSIMQSRGGFNVPYTEMLHESRHMNKNILMISQLPRTVDIISIEHSNIMFFKGVTMMQIMELQGHIGGMFPRSQMNEIVMALMNTPDKPVSFVILNAARVSFAGWIRNPEPNAQIADKPGTKLVEGKGELIKIFVREATAWARKKGLPKVTQPQIRAFAIEQGKIIPENISTLSFFINEQLSFGDPIEGGNPPF